MDSRIKIKQRQIILTIEDKCPIEFSAKDQKWIAEVIEDRLKSKFDIEVTLINIVDMKDE